MFAITRTNPTNAPKHRASYYLGGENELLSYAQGAFSSHCKWNDPYHNEAHRQAFIQQQLSADHHRDLIDSFETLPTNGVPPSLSPYEYLDRDLLVVVREGTEHANIYHAMTDFYNTFLMMYNYHLDAANTQVMILDSHPPGPFDMVWKILFSRNFPVLRPTLINSTLIAKHMYFVPPGYSSPLFVNLEATDGCKGGVDVLNDFSKFFLASFEVQWRPFRWGQRLLSQSTSSPVSSNEYMIGGGHAVVQQYLVVPAGFQHTSWLQREHDKTQPASYQYSIQAPRVIHIVFVSRRPYDKFVNRKKINRQVWNEAELFDWLGASTEDGGAASFPTAADSSFSRWKLPIRVDVVDFARISLKEQLTLIASTDILVGAHGAALTHSLFTPPWSSTAEFHPAGQTWHTLEHTTEWTGKPYYVWRSPDKETETNTGNGFSVDKQAFKNILIEMIDRAQAMQMTEGK